jgi:hypothetical protein
MFQRDEDALREHERWKCRMHPLNKSHRPTDLFAVLRQP